jgi:hypothetical protein
MSNIHQIAYIGKKTFHPIMSIPQPNKFTRHPIMSKTQLDGHMSSKIVHTVHSKWKT